MKKSILLIFFVQLITSSLCASLEANDPLTTYVGIEEIGINPKKGNASWWSQQSTTHKALIITAVCVSTSLLVMGFKKHGPSFFTKNTNDELENNRIRRNTEEGIRGIAAMPDLSFLLDDETRSKNGMRKTHLSKKEEREVNKKFYIILPRDLKITFTQRTPELLNASLDTNHALRKQLDPFEKTLLLYDFSKEEDKEHNILTPVDLVPIKMRWRNNVNHTVQTVEFLESHPLLKGYAEEGSLLDLYQEDIIATDFRLENYNFQRLCFGSSHYYILMPQNRD